MSPYDLTRWVLYCGAAIAFRLAIRAARVYFDTRRWQRPPYPTWRDVLR